MQLYNRYNLINWLFRTNQEHKRRINFTCVRKPTSSAVLEQKALSETHGWIINKVSPMPPFQTRCELDAVKTFNEQRRFSLVRIFYCKDPGVGVLTINITFKWHLSTFHFPAAFPSIFAHDMLSAGCICTQNYTGAAAKLQHTVHHQLSWNPNPWTRWLHVLYNSVWISEHEF